MFGGGGYNIWQVVPRAWSHIFLALINKPIQEGPLPEQWIKNGVRTHQCKLLDRRLSRLSNNTQNI